jgi:hypothetical protein
VYYALKCDVAGMTAEITKESGPPIPELAEGQFFTPNPGSRPFVFSVDNPGGEPLFDFYSGRCLMSRRLVDTLRAEGVDNLQTFDAELRDAATGASRRDFVVVNVLGLVAAADLDASQSITLGEGHVFTDLKIDASKACGLLMFRLAESLIDVIVHERIAKAIEAGGFRGVVLKPVS